MNSLQNMCERCERNKASRNQRCPFRSISNDYCEDYNNIERELKRKEQLEKVIDKSIDLLSISGKGTKSIVHNLLVSTKEEITNGKGN